MLVSTSTNSPFFYQHHKTAIIGCSAKIGENTTIWHNTHITSDAIIGSNCTIGQNCYIAGIVGNGCKIQNNVSIFKGVVLEDDVFMGPSSITTNVLTPRAFINRKNEFKPTLIKKGASIGAGAILLCGIKIGEYAMIGAGSVITKDVPDYALVYGNPARIYDKVDKNGEIVKIGIKTPEESLIRESLNMCASLDSPYDWHDTMK